MTRTNKGFFSLCIPLLALLIIFNSCEDPGSVGSDFVDRPTLTADTLSISDAKILSYQGYSGRLGFIPIGQYSDPLFGTVTSRGLIKPIRTTSIPDSIEMGENFTLQIELQVDSLESYGDTTSQSSFTIYEITSTWRGGALRINDEIPYGNQVGSFTLNAGEKKGVVDNLSSQWIEDYEYYFNNRDSLSNIDSTYNYDFGGLIIIPDEGDSKISFARSDASRFLMINEAQTDTITLPLRDWGYTLDRAGAVSPPNTFPVHTTLEGMLSITMPDSLLKADNNTKNIIRADLVFYEAEEELSSSLPDNHLRLSLSSMKLDLVEAIDPAYEYQFGEVDFFGFESEEEPSYQINITNYINDVIFGNETRQELILGIGSSSGILRSTLLYDETAPKQFRPKIIITSLVD